MKRLLLLSLIVSGCNLIDPPTHVTDDLQPFVDRVVYEYNIRGVKVNPIKVIFDEIDSNVGRYEPWPPWDKRIIIDPDFFDDNIKHWPMDIQKTVAHEFGHYMGRNHNNKEIDFCKPVSLMCTKCCVSDLEENWEYYFDELVGVKLNP